MFEKREELVALADRLDSHLRLMQSARNKSQSLSVWADDVLLVKNAADALRAQASASPPEREAAKLREALLSPQMQAIGQQAIRNHPHYEGGPVAAYGFAGAVLKEVAEALSSRDDGEAKSSDGPTYYDEGRDAEWFEKLSDSDFAERAIRAAQDLADSDITSVEQWIPIVAIVDDAARRIKRLISSGPSEAPSTIPADILAMKEALVYCRN